MPFDDSDQTSQGGSSTDDPPPHDTEAGLADTPNDPNMPSDSPLKAEAFSDPDGEYTKQLADVYRQHHARAEYYKALQQRAVDHFQDDANAQVAQPQQQPMTQFSQQQKNGASNTFMQILIAAGIASVVFGKHQSNTFGASAMMGGLGALMKGYAQGKAEKVKEDAQIWHQHNEAINAENKAKTQQYKDIIANKKLDMGQQMNLIRMYAGLNRDDLMEAKAKEGNIGKVMKVVHDRDKAIADFHKRTTKSIAPKAVNQDYRMKVLEKSGGKVDPDRSDEDLMKAQQILPWSKFNADRVKEKEQQAVDTKEAKETGKIPTHDNSDPLGLLTPKAGSAQPSVSPSALTGGSGL